MGTLLLYLCTVEEGGGTRFPQLGLEFRPQRGAGLYFANVDAQGAVASSTLHASVAVVSGVSGVSGVKYIATKWLRAQAVAAA